MSVTSDNIKKVAKLARIEIPEEDQQEIASQLSGIIGWVDKLGQANTDDVDPLTNVHDATLRMVKDEVSDGNKVDAVLSNAKNSKYNYFAVPKVIE